MKKIVIILLILIGIVIPTSCSKENDTAKIVVSDEKEKVDDNKDKEEDKIKIVYDEKQALSTLQLVGLYKLIGTKREDVEKHLKANNIFYKSDFSDELRYMAEANDSKSPFRRFEIVLRFGWHVTKYGKDKESTKVVKNAVREIKIFPRKYGYPISNSDYKKVMNYFITYFNYLVPTQKPTSIVLENVMAQYKKTPKTVEEAYKIMDNPNINVSAELEWNNNPKPVLANSSVEKNANITIVSYSARFHYYSIYIKNNLPKGIYKFLK